MATPTSVRRRPNMPCRLVRHLLDWFNENARDLPWRRTRDPYAIWVSEIMLQQTLVKTVIPFWERWMRELPTLEAVAKAHPDKIHKLWEGLGYYTRARNLQKAAKQIVEQHHGTFPQAYHEMLALPGIGRYTAGAICSIAFNQPTPILDGNVIRVLTRIFGIAENPKEKETNRKLWRLAEELVCQANKIQGGETIGEPAREDARPTRINLCSHLNQSLMELGALVCLPRNAQCNVCPAQQLCVAFREKRVAELPNPGKRKSATARRFIALIVQKNRQFLVRQRPAGTVNGHLWEFPNIEVFNGESGPDIAAKELFDVPISGVEPLCTIKHSITRYRITLDAFRASVGEPSHASPHKNGRSGTRITRPSETGVWKTRAQMSQLAFTAAHKKILNRLSSA